MTKIKTRDLMSIIKPVKSCGFMIMCANYAKAINAEFENGADDFEISGIYTKSGNPEIIMNYDHWLNK